MHQRLSAYAAIFRLVTDLAPIALLLKPIINSSSSDSIQTNLPCFSTHPTDTCGSAFKRKHIISHFDGHNNAQSLQGRRPLTIFFRDIREEMAFSRGSPRGDSGSTHDSFIQQRVLPMRRQLKDTISQDQRQQVERVTEVNNDWHQHLNLSPHLQTNDSWRPAIPQSAAVRDTAFNLGQHSHVHPARLE